MSINKWKVIIAISVTFNIVLIWGLFSIFQENNDMKKAVIAQYASQQEEVLKELERALANQGDKDEYVKALTAAFAIIYHNESLTRNSSQIGQFMEFPEALKQLNSPYLSRAVGYSLFNTSMDRPTDEWKD